MSEKAKHKRVHMILFLLYKILEPEKIYGHRNQIRSCLGKEQGMWDANGQETFLNDRNVLYLD